MNILGFYKDHIKQKLSPSQLVTLQILLYLISVHKTVQISKLSNYFPLPIKLESKGKHIQRFLTIKELSLPLFWFPLVRIMVKKLFDFPSELVLILDRTQWQDTNILMISLAWKKRALPIHWKILTHKGASNLTEQKAVIRPVLRLLKGQKIILTADREFHSIFLCHWLKKYQKKDVYFVLRQKKSTMIKRGKKYCKLSELKVNVGEAKLLLNQKITKILKVGTYNLLIYKKQKYRQKSVVEKWYILTNLSSTGKVKKIYSQRMGIEAMFQDYKTGGYNLESAKANETRLNNLILLIAISYTISSFEGQKIKNKGVQEYISRTNERGRKERRHSNFFVGLSGMYWAINDNFIWELVENLMRLNPHKFLYYCRGIKAMKTVVN
ncbi:MAG: IS4 family transposase [Okeania sp. SIO2G4]|uniref:IS4 family transposase n=2 Tax=Okeania TaxID=1458928 RepID=UPI0013C86CF7|nr:IS4 family transposase [Okeania sp. SIO2G4]NEP07388.1 IS4 family transposase [Okeania sp. SIO4D6]NEP38730.1 IS4 family transposase [Okeania sp. SIO2H7]NEQ95084.1 IS4 family transposase [Okeania sp. SIO2G4]